MSLHKITGYLIGCAIAGIFSGCTQKAYQKKTDGIVVTVPGKNGRTGSVRLQCIDDNIIRVTASPNGDLDRPKSLMIQPRSGISSGWQVTSRDSAVILSTQRVQAWVSLQDGHVRFTDTSGRTILSEKPGGRSFTPVTVDSTSSYRIRQVFENNRRDELYGLGENQLGITDIRDQDIMMAQHNSVAFIPFFVSSGHYGILWDNNSITHFGNPDPWLPLDSLDITGQTGKAGVLDASYASGKGIPVVKTGDASIAYDALEDQHSFPKGFSLSSSAEVDWSGSFASPYTGLHTFRIYSGGYVRIWIDGVVKLDRWRQCWNPVKTLLPLQLIRGEKHTIRIQWRPDGSESYLSVRWEKPATPERLREISLSSEMGRTVDYYFIAGANADSIISGYRTLTCTAPMMPLWAYGFWQSREHYNSEKEILSIARTFRSRHIPIDNIVQDWFYWKKDRWGSQQFDSSRYPDPGGMIDSLHQRYHMHFMISVWPKFYTGIPEFKSFWDKGWLYKKNVQDAQKDWVGYVSTFYDAFNPAARHAFWHLVDTRLFSLGVDAWWLDASEPDILSNTTIAAKKALMNPTALGPSTEYFNAYPLVNAEAFYHGQRTESPDQRVFILTRSAFAGSQRYAAATWSGDIGATWQDLKNQIATGISFSLSGIPYWTMDIGGFATESRYQHPSPRDLAEWREQLTRWYQFGAFCPLFRSHGQLPYREPFNVAPEGSPAYQSILYYDRLRYRLLPYIYSLAGDVYLHNYTIMRGLVMDFPDDSVARAITDQYLFGPALLVNPVYTYHAISRPVYLPQDQGWYNLYDGKYYAGGQTIIAEAPFSRIPVFVRAGSIVPLGPALEYTGEKPADTLTLYVYGGADGHFDLYEDQGLNNDYEHGAYSVIPISYRESSGQLTIGKRRGNFDAMLKSRVLRVHWVTSLKPAGIDATGVAADTTVSYSGDQIVISLQGH
jgi:alpha-D-xyloside xylohydrolase